MLLCQTQLLDLHAAFHQHRESDPRSFTPRHAMSFVAALLQVQMAWRIRATSRCNSWRTEDSLLSCSFTPHSLLPQGTVSTLSCCAPPQVPTAAYEEEEQPVQLLHKLGGQLFRARQAHSPFNVVAWHGNYVPYKYDLAKFCPMNTVRFDHADPSIFTVLTCPSAIAGSTQCAPLLAAVVTSSVVISLFGHMCHCLHGCLSLRMQGILASSALS